MKFSKERFAARFFPTRSAKDESSPDEFQFVGRKEYFRRGREGRKEGNAVRSCDFLRRIFIIKNRAFARERFAALKEGGGRIESTKSLRRVN